MRPSISLIFASSRVLASLSSNSAFLITTSRARLSLAALFKKGIKFESQSKDQPSIKVLIKSEPLIVKNGLAVLSMKVQSVPCSPKVF